MNGHPDVEALAAYAAGDLTPAEAAPVAEHVMACAAWASEVGAIRQVGADLAALPPLAMPADVAAAVDAALAAERQQLAESASEPEPAPVVPIERRRRRSLAPLLTGAAAAALIGAIGYGVVSRDLGRDDATSAAPGAGADAAGPEALQLYSSGFAYDQSNVEEGALQLLGGTATQFRTSGMSAPTAGTPSPVSTGFTSGGEVATTGTDSRTDMVQLRDLERCLDLLREDDSVRPVAVDYSTFEGQPAAVIVLPFRPDTYDVFVVTLRCGETDDATMLHFQRVERA